MSDKWIAKELGRRNPETNDSSIDELLEEDVIILIYGENIFGDRVFSYVKLPYILAEQVRIKIEANEKFDVREYGEVVAAGKGEPTARMEEEIAEQFGMVTMKKFEEPSLPEDTSIKFWSEDDNQ
jgi:hypothetical protein